MTKHDCTVKRSARRDTGTLCDPFQYLFLKVSNLSLPALLFLSMSALQAATTYTYVGNNYNDVTSPYTTSMHVSMTIVLANPIGANLSNVTLSPTSFVVSNGVNSFTQANGTGTFDSVDTDASGIPIHWAFSFTASANIFNTVETYNLDGFQLDRGAGPGNSSFERGRFFNSPGTMTVSNQSTAPEPSSLSLMALSGGALWMARRRRKSTAGPMAS